MRASIRLRSGAVTNTTIAMVSVPARIRFVVFVAAWAVRLSTAPFTGMATLYVHSMSNGLKMTASNTKLYLAKMVDFMFGRHLTVSKDMGANHSGAIVEGSIGIALLASSLSTCPKMTLTEIGPGLWYWPIKVDVSQERSFSLFGSVFMAHA